MVGPAGPVVPVGPVARCFRRARWVRWAKSSNKTSRRTVGHKKRKPMGAKAFTKKWRRRGWQTFGCSPAAWGVFRRTLTAGRGYRVGGRFPAHFDAARFPGKHQNKNSQKGNNSVLISNELESFLFTMVPSPPPPGHFRMHPPRKRKKTQFVLFFRFGAAFGQPSR